MFLFKHIFCIPGTPVLLWLSNALVKEPPALAVGRGGAKKGKILCLHETEQLETIVSPRPL